MNLSELKQKPIDELLEMTKALGLDNLARSRKMTLSLPYLKNTLKAVKISMAMEFLKFSLMVLGFYGRPTHLT